MSEHALVPQSDADRELLAKAKSEIGSQRLPPIPTVRMFNVKAKTKIEGVKIGEYYIEESAYNPETKEREKKHTPLGANPTFVIIKKRMAYSHFDKDEERLVAWTNELDAFAPEQKVYIAFNDGNSPRIISELSKGQFKDLRNLAKLKKSKMETMTREEMIAMQLKFKNVLYLWHPDTNKGYKMFASNASSTGVPDGEAKYGSFDAPQPGSLTEFQNKMTAQEPEVIFKAPCILGSRPKKDVNGEIEYYLMTFTAGEQFDYETFRKMLFAWNALNSELETRLETEFLSMGSGESKKTDHDVIHVDDLPDL